MDKLRRLLVSHSWEFFDESFDDAYTNTQYHSEREVKKANRELQSQTAKMTEIQKIDHLHKRCSDLLADMKRHERENLKNKKRADQLQKDKDQIRSELTKNNTLKEKLEKLCRELQKENNKLKVRARCAVS